MRRLLVRVVQMFGFDAVHSEARRYSPATSPASRRSMTTTIKLRSPKDLGPAMRRLGRNMDTAAVTALRKTARWGAAEALRMSATSSPRPRATGTFERSFVVTKLPDGAALSNSAAHARFVEIGRKAGRMPPVQAIVDWMIAKRIDKKLGRKSGESRDAQIRAVALRIARKIGKRGTKGRLVMRRTMPGLAKRLRIELAMEMRKTFERSGGG
jgi:hypothetical protein